MIKKQTCRQVEFAVPADHRGNIKSEKSLILGPCQRTLKKPVEPACDGNTNWSWCTWNGSQRNGKKIGTVGNRKKNGDKFRLQHC